MNEHDHFESHLRILAPRELPPGWKAGVLANAAAAERRRFRPKPVVFALAACWVAILALRVTTPETTSAVAGHHEIHSESDAALAVAWIEQRRALIEVSALAR